MCMFLKSLMNGVHCQFQFTVLPTLHANKTIHHRQHGVARFFTPGDSNYNYIPKKVTTFKTKFPVIWPNNLKSAQRIKSNLSLQIFIFPPILQPHWLSCPGRWHSSPARGHDATARGGHFRNSVHDGFIARVRHDGNCPNRNYVLARRQSRLLLVCSITMRYTDPSTVHGSISWTASLCSFTPSDTNSLVT